VKLSEVVKITMLYGRLYLLFDVLCNLVNDVLDETSKCQDQASHAFVKFPVEI
jgi:hypothetical protein